MFGLADLINRFEVIFGGDEVKYGKPNPEIYRKVAKHCNVLPVDCVVIEDSPPGVIGASLAGMPVILIPDMAQISCEIKRLACTICNDLFEVENLISFPQ